MRSHHFPDHDQDFGVLHHEVDEAIVAEIYETANDEHCHQDVSVLIEGEMVTSIVVNDILCERGALLSVFIEAPHTRENDCSKLPYTHAI